MPIERSFEAIRPTQAEFGQIAYDVMRCVYAIHKDFGRFFDEAVYKKELAHRMPGIELELPVIVTHDDFRKVYKLDVLASRRAVFEFKAVESIAPRHLSQTINYLFLFDLPHGKIINMRPERVYSEFVNCRQRLAMLKSPTVDRTGFDSNVLGGSFFYDRIMDMVQDWGTGLELTLYEEALTHFLGGEERVILPVSVIGGSGRLHDQHMRHLSPGVAFKLTAFTDRLDAFESHAYRLLRHTTLQAMHWANITHQHVTFRTLR